LPIVAVLNDVLGNTGEVRSESELSWRRKATSEEDGALIPFSVIYDRHEKCGLKSPARASDR